MYPLLTSPVTYTMRKTPLVLSELQYLIHWYVVKSTALRAPPRPPSMQQWRATMRSGPSSQPHQSQPPSSSRPRRRLVRTWIDPSKPSLPGSRSTPFHPHYDDHAGARLSHQLREGLSGAPRRIHVGRLVSGGPRTWSLCCLGGLDKVGDEHLKLNSDAYELGVI